MTFHAVCAHVMRGAACSPRKRSARRAARDVRIRLVLPFVLLQMVVSLVFPSGAESDPSGDIGAKLAHIGRRENRKDLTHDATPPRTYPKVESLEHWR